MTRQMQWKIMGKSIKEKARINLIPVLLLSGVNFAFYAELGTTTIQIVSKKIGDRVT